MDTEIKTDWMDYERIKINYKCSDCGHEGSKVVPKDAGAHLKGYTGCFFCGNRAEVIEGY